MLSCRTVLITLVLVSVASTFGLIAYGLYRVSETSLLSIAATSSVLAVYFATALFLLRNARSASNEDWIVCLMSFAASFIFISEIVLEYMLLPPDNTRWGYLEFGGVFCIYTLAAVIAAYKSCSLWTATKVAVATAAISSMVWYVAVLVTFYAYLDSERQMSVFKAEGNYEDFVQSGMTNFHAFIMEDFLGAGFFHLLLGPLLAAVLGTVGGSIGIAMRRARREKQHVV